MTRLSPIVATRAALLTCWCCLLAMLPATTLAQGPDIEDGRYSIQSRHSGLSLDVFEISTASGANIVQWEYLGGDNQQWEIRHLSGEWYSIRAGHSDMAMEVYQNSTQPGGEVRQGTYTGAANQQWRLEENSMGFYKIVSRHSGLVLDVWNWSSDNGGDIRQWDDTGGTNQQWTLELLSAADPEPNPDSGLSERPDNTTCLVSNFVESTSIELERVVPNLSFNRPVLYLPHPSQQGIWYVAEQHGAIYRVDRNAGTRQLLVNISDHYPLDTQCYECGLLGMAFHPDFDNNGYIYLSFVEGIRPNITSHLARFVSPDNGLTLQSAGNTPQREDLLSLDQPYDIHNGGHIAFGPDDYLYLGLGDGGPANDATNQAQTVTSWLGSILRLTDEGDPAPGNNVPGALPEIYAYGLRNPWRWSFDRETDELWLGDVGQNAWEEVNIISNGGNYGWRCYEGYQRTNNGCSSSGPYIDPVASYGRTEGVSITGGYVYRGSAIPGLYGVYIFGDFGSGTLWGLFPNGDGGYDREQLLSTGRSVVSFGEGPDGELYVVDHGGGIYQIVPSDNAASGPPQNLSDTGCVDPANPAQPATGLIPYDINEPFWSDGAEKARYMVLPNDATIGVGDNGDFEFPEGTVLVKVFRLNGQLIETRLFMRRQEGNWKGYSYRWNAAQTEATLLSGALDVDMGEVTWHYPSQAECSVCHTASAGFALGPESRQLNRNFTYPSTAIDANQLETWESVGLFDQPLSDAIQALFMPPSDDSGYPTAERARSYLHSNCANCHQPGGPTPVNLDLRVDTPFAQTQTCDVQPQAGDLGIANARIIAPGDSTRSVLLQRMQETGDDRMPPISSHVPDAEATQLIARWINAMSQCP